MDIESELSLVPMKDLKRSVLVTAVKSLWCIWVRPQTGTVMTAPGIAASLRPSQDGAGAS